MIEKWTWALAAVSLTGVFANIHKKRWCFFIWCFTNSAWMCVFFYLGVYAHAVLSGVYLATSIYGLAKWRKAGA